MTTTTRTQRIASVDPATATGPVAELFTAVKSKLGLVPNMVKAMAASPAVANAYVAFSGALAHGTLSARQREQIALLAAEHNGCTYCLSAHSAIAAKVGIDAAGVDEARNGRASDPRTAAILRLAKAVLEKRGHLADADLTAAHAAGLDDGQVAEVVANVALNVLTNYFNEAFHTEVDFPIVAPRGS